MSATIPLKDQLRCARRFYEEYRKPELLAICLTLEKLCDLEAISEEIRGTEPPYKTPQEAVGVPTGITKPTATAAPHGRTAGQSGRGPSPAAGKQETLI